MSAQRVASYTDQARTATQRRRFDAARAFERLAAEEAARDGGMSAEQSDLIDRQAAERLAAEGDPAAAAQIGDEIVARGRALPADERVDLLRDVALWHAHAGAPARAADLLERAVEVAEELGPAYHPTVLARYALAQAYWLLGRRSDALGALRQAAEGCQSVAEQNPPMARKLADAVAELVDEYTGASTPAAPSPAPDRPAPAGAPASTAPPEAPARPTAAAAPTRAGQVARPSGVLSDPPLMPTPLPPFPPPPTPPVGPRPVDEEALKRALAELDELVGLQEVKEQVHRLTDFLRIQVLRETRGRKTTAIGHHVQLIGPPGTGKTTVARLLARIYSALGILGSDKLVEATRADMVAGYVGQTAPKTNAVVDSALDGMLFIDEAYSLGRAESGQDFGAEAIAELVKRMEDDRGRLVVVVAGYSKEMGEFLEANSGLRDRFAERLDFPDYLPEELVQIYERFCTTNDYALSESAKPVLRDVVQHMHDARDSRFANARAMRNLFEDTIKAQAQRLADRDAAAAPITDAELTAIEPADIEAASTAS